MTRISSGVISVPPPMPVMPTRMPTPSPKRTTTGSMLREMQAALDLVGGRPAAVAGAARHGAVRAADRVVAAVMQGVVDDLVRADVAPDVLLAPVRQRRALVLVARVEHKLRRARAARRLVATQPGDPRVYLAQRALERLDLAHPAAGIGVVLPEAVDFLVPVDVDRDPVAFLDLPPGLVGLREQDAGVEREDARLGLDPQEHVEDHRRLLLEGAGDVQARVELVDDVGEHLLR